MKTIAFFNNKSGVGSTSLVYHLAWMFSELDYRVVVADFDPQADLSGMFLRDSELEPLLEATDGKTVAVTIAPLFKKTGDMAVRPHIEKITERIGLLVGDLALSTREGELAEYWCKCLDGEERAFRVTTAFARLVAAANDLFAADLTLIDVGPNLGPLNRAVLIASDHAIIPLTADSFSLQGLRHVGSTLADWRKSWRKRLDAKPNKLNFALPSDPMQPLGYIVRRCAIRLDRPVPTLHEWISSIPGEYRRAVLPRNAPTTPTIDADEHLLANLQDYRLLMSLAQEANKPMFMLKPADGALGTYMSAVMRCYEDYRSLAQKIIAKLDESKPSSRG